jgi:DNA end-binding protein Ku
VPYEDVVKGYELSTGEMVVLDDEDLADLPLPTTKSIEVLHFAPAEQLDPILFNRSYFVEPEAAGARAYVLLRDALEQSGRIAIAQVALRQRESLATLRSRDGVLVLETLLWPDEIRAAVFPFIQQEIEVRPQELTMAASLIDSMTSDFDPDAHHDGYREALVEVVEAKVQGRELAQPGALEIAAGPTTSLADALRASLAAAQTPGAGEEDGADGATKAIDAGPGPAKPGSAKPAGSRTAGSKTAGSKTASSRTAGSRPAGSRTGSASTGGAKTSGDADSDESGTERGGAAKPAKPRAGAAKSGTRKAATDKTAGAKSGTARKAS